MKPTISIITLGVKCMKTSYKFYKEGLGFPTSAKIEDSIYFFKTNGTCLAIYPFDKLAEDANFKNTIKPQTGFQGITLAHNVKSDTEVEDILELATKAGATIIKPATRAFWGGYSGYFSDPDGYLWEVAHANFEMDENGCLIIP
jgi:uncharacterized glyoxalase superfamily protein PhnB